MNTYLENSVWLTCSFKSVLCIPSQCSIFQTLRAFGAWLWVRSSSWKMCMFSTCRFPQTRFPRGRPEFGSPRERCSWLCSALFWAKNSASQHAWLRLGKKWRHPLSSPPRNLISTYQLLGFFSYYAFYRSWSTSSISNKNGSTKTNHQSAMQGDGRGLCCLGNAFKGRGPFTVAKRNITDERNWTCSSPNRGQ